MKKGNPAIYVVIGVPIIASMIAVMFTSDIFFPTPEAQAGTLSVVLADRPVELERLDITITSLLVHKVGEDDGLWIQLSLLIDSEELFNLLDLQDGATMELAKEAIPVGNYNKIRMIIGSAFATFKGQESSPLQLDVPSEHIEVTTYFTIESETTTTMLLDVEAEWVSISTSNRLRPIVKASVLEEPQTE